VACSSGCSSSLAGTVVPPGAFLARSVAPYGRGTGAVHARDGGALFQPGAAARAARAAPPSNRGGGNGGAAHDVRRIVARMGLYHMEAAASPTIFVTRAPFPADSLTGNPKIH
jgi:hypothetical protein